APYVGGRVGGVGVGAGFLQVGGAAGFHVTMQDGDRLPDLCHSTPSESTIVHLPGRRGAGFSRMAMCPDRSRFRRATAPGVRWSSATETSFAVTRATPSSATERRYSSARSRTDPHFA